MENHESPKIDWRKITDCFGAVRDALNAEKTKHAYRLCWKKPRKFYLDHTPAEAIEILTKEAAENLEGGL